MLFDTLAPRRLPRLRRATLAYLGGFLPPSSFVDQTSFSYGGTALATTDVAPLRPQAHGTSSGLRAVTIAMPSG